MECSLTLRSNGECTEHIIYDKALVEELSSKSKEDIEKALKLSCFIINDIPSFYRDEGITTHLKEIVRAGNLEVINSVGAINENLLCLTSGNSSLLGKFNEKIIEKYLRIHFPHFDIIDTTVSGEKCGDIVINTHTNMGKISIESKNYGPERTIPTAEIDKFKRDLTNSGIRFGIFVSTNSRITGKNAIDYEVYEDKIIIYVGPAGHDCSLLNLGIHYLITIFELDAVHNKRISVKDNREIFDKLRLISKAFEVNLTRLNNCFTSINETEKKMSSLMANLRKEIQLIISDFTIHLDKIQSDISDMKEGTNKDYATFQEIIDIVRNGRPDKNMNKQMLLERITNALNDTQYRMKIEASDFFFYKDDIYCGKINYKGKSKIDVFFKENTDYVSPYNHRIVSFKNNNYIIELKDNIETWDFITNKI